MAMNYEQFMQASGAELVAGNIIVGIMGSRKIVGTNDDTFNLNEDGQALMAELEAAAASSPKSK